MVISQTQFFNVVRLSVNRTGSFKVALMDEFRGIKFFEPRAHWQDVRDGDLIVWELSDGYVAPAKRALKVNSLPKFNDFFFGNCWGSFSH